ncbi:MAG: Cytochrome c6 [Legionellaceae bacterium]
MIGFKIQPKFINTAFKRCFTSLICLSSLLILPQVGLAEARLLNNAPDKIAAYPKPNYGKEEKQRQYIVQGELLAKAGDCIACHTDVKNNGEAFAGGAGINTPFGTFYAPNITPDKETGIGKWTDDEFVKAMHEGVAPNGSHYFPVFPYPNFNKLSRSDVLAIKAYLFSIPSVKKPNRENDITWPFSIRFLQIGWKTLFFYFQKGQYQYDPTHSAEWNQGAYLVQGLGHCGMCHTPHNALGGEKKSYALTGGFVDGYYAPDITSNALSEVPVEEIVDVFKKNNKLHNAGKVGGPMLEVNQDSLHYLPEKDLRAIAIYLKTVKSQNPNATANANGVVSADTGREIYQDKCAVCHDSGAAGAPKVGDGGVWDERLKLGLDTVITHAIKGYNSMPPKGTCMSCSDAEIKAAVEYMIDESKVGGESKPIDTVPVKLSLADGKRIYQENCSVCHAKGELGSPKVGDKLLWNGRIHQNIDVLFTHAIKGYNRMPAKGACVDCSTSEIIAAVKYMVQESKTSGDYTLW